MIKKSVAISLFIFWAIVVALLVVGLLFYQNKKPVNATPQTQAGQTNGTQNSSKLTLSDVAKHNTAKDCWLVINNKAYDVSSYIGSHPGGKNSITTRCGQEVTGIFASIHSNFAWDLLKKYYVADIGSRVTTTVTNSPDTVLKQMEVAVTRLYPGADVVDIKPKNDIYVAKIIYQGKLYEIHLDANGKFLKEEVANDEFDWSSWSTDDDD